MRNKIYTKLIVIFFINSLFFAELHSKIKNRIIAKVGNSLITSVDVQNEVMTSLLINKIEVTQENIDKQKNFAIQSLVRKLIKEAEINKYEVTRYNEKDLVNYLTSNAKNLNTDLKGLKEIFVKNGLDYNSFVKKRQIDLMWNTLIYNIYQNQVNINMIDVENEIKIIQKNEKNETDFGQVREEVLQQKKDDKLNLFSRSHFSNLEASTTIKFL